MSNGFLIIKSITRRLMFRSKQLNTFACFHRFFSSDVPSNLSKIIDTDTVQLLERLSLVNFEGNYHIAVLEESIKFADKIAEINTDNVEPLVSVLEHSCLRLRPDDVTEGNCRDDILMNAAVIEEDYFVAPPGNIPLITSTVNCVNKEETKPNVLKLGEHLLYLKPVFNENNNSLLEYFKFGPFGELFCQNIRNEWLYSNVVSRDELVLPFSSTKDGDVICLTGELKEHYENARFLSGGKLPFSIVYTRQLNKQNNNVNSDGPKENYYFRPSKHTQLKYVAFATPTDGQQFFYYWQRQRKIWWRKFSANPGRFSLAEIQTDADKMEFTDIRAEFEWGVQSIEVIKNVAYKWFESLSDDERKHFEFQSGRKMILPHVIESTMSVEEAALIFLCDAFYVEEFSSSQSDRDFRNVLKLHRRLTPYKTVFSNVTTSSEKINEDLKMLAVYLMQELKKAGVSTLSNIPDQKSIEDEFLLHDSLGIPFTIVLSEPTLSDGILGIRSRETTLQEKLHVSQLTEHLTKLIKSY